MRWADMCEHQRRTPSVQWMWYDKEGKIMACKECEKKKALALEKKNGK